MRTQLLNGLTFLCAGLALLCGPAARAQSQPAAASNGYPEGSGSGSQAVPAGYWGSGYPRQSWYGYPQYYQGYGYYPYNYYYPYYNYNNYNYNRQAPAGDPYPEGTTMQAAPSGALPSGDGAPLFQPVLPVVPLSPDEVPGEDGVPHGDKAHAPARDRFWFLAGYESAWIKPGRNTTPLLTQGSPADAHPGALDQPGTTILFGDRVDYRRFDGVRLDLGFYLNDCWAVEWVGEYLFPRHVKTAVASDANGNPILARPVFNVLDQTERAFINSSPGIATGAAFVDARSEFLGSELNLRTLYRPSDCFRLELLGGFRFLRLQETLATRDLLQPLVPGVFTFLGFNPVDPTMVLEDADTFRTVNHFYGIQLGGQATWEGKRLFASAFGKVAVGVTDEEVDINGQTALFTPAQPFVASGGILALPTNIGQHTRPVFGFVPEGGLAVGVKVTPHLRLTAAYSFLYWNSVVRPGNQIDRGVNPTLVPSDATFGTLTGPLRPAFRFGDETFWVHTLTVGVDLHF
jgi:hypothetical protein